MLILPASLGLTDTINAGLARVFFSWTLHAIVYFWLMPAYIAFYTIVPRAIGGRLYSDTMGRVAFVLFLVFSMPIGIHHLFADPQVGAGFKFVHAVMTAMVSVPTLLTVFTIVASVEIAGRLRGGKGALGWVKALPWDNPMMLAVTFSFVMLGFGGAGGIINMSYQLNETVHNTQWVTGHFHLIFGGAIVIMYFMIAYELWPQLTGCAPLPQRLVKLQLWLWFVGMLVLSMPWHLVGLLGMPRRMAYYDYTHPDLAAAGVDRHGVDARRPAAGDLGRAPRLHPGHGTQDARRARAVHVQRDGRIPAATRRRLLNGFALWVAMMIGLTVVNYGFPIAQLADAEGCVGAGRSDREPMVKAHGALRVGQSLVPLERGVAGRADGAVDARGLRRGCLRCTGTSPRRACGRASAARPACRRAGRDGSRRPSAGPPSTDVVLEPAMARAGADDAIGRGATLALNCTMCHGAQGMSASNAPNLAGQYPEVVIKQMHDYKSGKRSSSLMQALATNLTDRDIRDLAAYYASLPKARTAPTTYDESLPALVRVGDPLRNIAPCISCHGGVDHKLGTPWLEGMPKEYLVAQLGAFKTGERRNDAHAQMRNMAREMTSKEIDEVSTFYARKASAEPR